MSGSPALQVRFGLGFVQLFDHCLDLRRIAEQPNAPTDPAARLKAEVSFALLVSGIGALST